MKTPLFSLACVCHFIPETMSSLSIAPKNMASSDVQQIEDKRASQALSLQFSTQALVRMELPDRRTLWEMAKMLGSSATRKGSLAVERSFPNPFGIHEPASPTVVASAQTLDHDPEKNVPCSETPMDCLPPCDRGRRAWACLLGAAAIEGLMWGASRSSHLETLTYF